VPRYQEPEFLPWDGRRVPITFIGGYLGAGKTTVINSVLTHSDRPIAVVVNDVGSINIDAALIRKRDRNLIEVTNGCVCCSSLDGMGAAFDQIRARPEPPDHVLVELSGVAEPQRMVPWGNSAGFMLDGVVVVVAADQVVDGLLPAWIQQHISLQIQAADLLVLTKADIVDTLTSVQATAKIAELAPNTPVINAALDIGNVGTVGRFLALGGRRAGDPTDLPAPSLFDAHSIGSTPIPNPINTAELRDWLAALQKSSDKQLMRAKGIANTTDQGLILIQLVGNRVELSPVPQSESHPPTDLVMITLSG
jgi:G3E family GTPase